MNMKKTLLTLAILGLATVQSFGQRYMTREGYIQFYSSTPMEDIEASSNQATSALDKSNGQLVFRILMRSFTFEKALMQEHFNENYVESEKFPNAQFAGSITNLSDVDFDTDGAYNVTITGKLTVHGVERDQTVTGKLHVKGEELLLETEFMVKPEDHDIEIPSVVRDNIASEIKVTVKAKYQASGR